MDRQGKQLEDIQAVEKEKKFLNRRLLRSKLSEDEKQLIRFALKQCDVKIDLIRRRNMIDTGDILSCSSMNL